MKNLCILSLSVLIPLIAAPFAVSEEPAEKLQRMTVTGGADYVDKVPGSAYFLTPEQLEKVQGGYGDIHRILRQVPGVNIQEEDGFGLRPNIGFRGTDTERSSSITLMEDSVLIAPAPYSAPSAYYFPSTGRIESIEVTKGASTIKYGPSTIGGALNLISTSIPKEDSLNAELKFGEFNTKIAHVSAGTSTENAGFLLETYQAETDGFKQLDGGGDTGFDVEDYVAKLRLNTDKDAERYHEVEFKFGYYNQLANETYLGLTDQDFDDNPFRRYASSQLDNITVQHDQYQVSHYGELTDNLDITSAAYLNYTSRNWYKLETVRGNTIASILDRPEEFAEEIAFIRGDTDSPDDTFALRDNNREYVSRGIQTTLGYDLEHDGVEHTIELGLRFHNDYEDRFQQEDNFRIENGTLVLTSQGAPGSHSNRIGEADAWAFFLQDKADFGALTLTPGLRYELIDFQRRDYGTNDPTRSGADLSIADTSVTALIPGLGAHYELSPTTSIFGGIHKGFSPPGPTSDDSIEEEESINYEFGGNYIEGYFWSELVGFFNDYENLLGADTLSSGGTGTGDLFNGGEATSYGIEAVMKYDLGKAMESKFGIPLRASYTYTKAEFGDSFDSDFFGVVEDGDAIPYVPRNQASFGVGVEYDKYALNLDGHYVQATPTVPGQAGIRNTRRTDSATVFDIKADYQFKEGVKLFALIENLFDKEYIVARRPAGARPGRPRTFLAGVKLNF